MLQIVPELSARIRELRIPISDVVTIAFHRLNLAAAAEESVPEETFFLSKPWR